MEPICANPGPVSTSWLGVFSNATRDAMLRWHCSGDVLRRDAHAASASTKQPSLEELGFVLIKDLLSPPEVKALRKLILRAAYSGAMMRGGPPFGGHFVPDPFDDRFAAVRPVIERVLEKPALHAALRRAFRGAPYLFTGMSDLQVNRSVHWHRDLVRAGIVRRSSSLRRIHSSRMIFGRDHSGQQRFNLFRIIVYLQDHSHPTDTGALRVLPTSHANPSCEHSNLEGSPFAAMGGTARGQNASLAAKLYLATNDVYAKVAISAERWRCRVMGFNGLLPQLHQQPPPLTMHPRSGEAILFDQRIFHMGKMQQDASFHRDRVSLQISFGRDDFLTREWSLADNVRRKGMLHEVTQVSATTMP